MPAYMDALQGRTNTFAPIVLRSRVANRRDAVRAATIVEATDFRPDPTIAIVRKQDRYGKTTI